MNISTLTSKSSAGISQSIQKSDILWLKVGMRKMLFQMFSVFIKFLQEKSFSVKNPRFIFKDVKTVRQIEKSISVVTCR